MASTEWAVVLEGSGELWDESKVKRDEGGQFAEKDGPDAGQKIGEPPAMELTPPAAPDDPYPYKSKVREWYLDEPDNIFSRGEIRNMFAIEPAENHPRLVADLKRLKPDMADDIQREFKVATILAKGEFSGRDGRPCELVNRMLESENLHPDVLYHMAKWLAPDELDALGAWASKNWWRFRSDRDEGFRRGEEIIQQIQDKGGAKPPSEFELEYLHDRASERERVVDGLLPSKIGKKAETKARWTARNLDWMGRGKIVGVDLLVEGQDGFLRKASVDRDGNVLPSGDSTGELSPRWQTNLRRLAIARRRGDQEYCAALAHLVRNNEWYVSDFSLGRATPEQVREFLDRHEPAFLREARYQAVPEPKDWKPVTSLQDAEEQLAAMGIRAVFRLREPAHPVLHNEPVSGSIENINAQCRALVSLLRTYPDAYLGEVGYSYALANARFNENRAANAIEILEDPREKAKTPYMADKKAKEKMVFPPDPGDKYHRLFIGGHWTKYARSISINDASLMGSAQQAERDRVKALSGEEDLGTVDDSPAGVMRHEFGHCLDDTYGIRDRKEFQDVLNELDDKALERELSLYAASKRDGSEDRNIVETFAEAFTESFADNARPLGRRVRGMLDNLIEERQKARAA